MGQYARCSTTKRTYRRASSQLHSIGQDRLLPQNPTATASRYDKKHKDNAEKLQAEEYLGEVAKARSKGTAKNSDEHFVSCRK